MTERSQARPDVFVQSLQRGLLVIRALSSAEPLTLSEVAQRTGVSRAAARRFLLTLEQLGYVDGRDGRFSLTPRVLELGYAYLSSLTLPQVALPHLKRLSEEVQESSSMSVLDGEDVVYVARVPTRRIMSVAISVGTRFPAYATSMGRVLLAAVPDPEASVLLAELELRGLTRRTITNRRELLGELERVRRAGYALVDEELEEGLRSIAVPVRRPDGTVAAAVNVSAQAIRTSVRDLQRRILPALRQTAGAIEQDLRLGQP